MEDLPRAEYLRAFFSARLPPGGLPARFAVVTAFNPNGRPRSLEDNEKADAALEKELRAAGLAYFRAAGGSPDGRHQEPGFAVAADSPEVIRTICRRFEQEAFYWIEDSVIYLLNTGGKLRHRVDSWAARWRPAKEGAAP